MNEIDLPRTNPFAPAFPLPGANHRESLVNGLSKREYFAAMAMQGMIAGSQGLDISPQEFAQSSVELADALIVELNKDKS